MRSASGHPDIVSKYLADECELGRVLGPFSAPPIPLQISSFGVIPKRHQTNKWRLIVDLSSPTGHSVNDGIDGFHCSFSYISIDNIAAAILQLGRGALVAKTDVKQAYRQIPVHPQDRRLLGMQWQDGFYVDATLPFGLRSAPIIFSAVADALEWVVRSMGASHIYHYMDDFILVGPANSPACEQNLRLLMQTCSNLGVAMASEKTEGPCTRLTVLGIQVDTLAMTLSLPHEKLRRLHDLLGSWRGRRAGSRRDLESLVGMLQDASRVVRPGRIFLRRIYNLLAQTAQFKQHYTVRLNREFQADVEWWFTFIQSWNGVSILRPIRTDNPDAEVWSDASGSGGCGAHWLGQWFQLPWLSLPIASESIAAKELFPIIVAAAVWGLAWRGSTVCFFCDNQAVVEVLNYQSAKDSLLCHQLRCLFYIRALYDFDIIARHTPGVSNIAADALSRDDLPLFLSQVHNAAPSPTPIPLGLRQGLSVPHPTWTSRDWMSWLNGFLARP